MFKGWLYCLHVPERKIQILHPTKLRIDHDSASNSLYIPSFNWIL